MRPRSVLPLSAASAALVAAMLLPGPLAAQQVYKWKDAKGVTHFTSEPPPDQRYEAREVDHHQAKPAATATNAGATAPAAKAEDPGCATARGNLALLAGDRPLTMDVDGNGKPRPLTEADRTRQRNLAQAILDAKCGGNAAAPAPASADAPEPEEQ